MTDVHPAAAAGFAAAADVYERARPSYPQDAVDWIVERAGLRPGRVVVDLAAGTGKLTRLLVPSGAEVVAVEPVPEMRAKLEEVVPGVSALYGTAERLPFADGSADVVTVAQAFHWFDHERALAELHRVLRPDGLLVLVWNSRDLDDPLQRALEELLAPLRDGPPAQEESAWRDPLEASALFGPIETRRFRYEQAFTAQDLVDRVHSTSFVATMRPIDREELLVRVRALAHGLAEPFRFPYLTEVHTIPRSRDRAR
ncbi:MAG TPA: methyltransferase domain-containing protein [Gaiellaceae bacterium]|nr:methyltransferase domain-containing protein [Gaiellaceae bacterium]